MYRKNDENVANVLSKFNKLNTEDIDVADITMRAADKYAEFMDIILPGWNDDPNSKETPMRVARMFVQELMSGLYLDPPKITAFENVDYYTGIVFQGNIEVKSMCSHHHMPFFGLAHVAYIPNYDEDDPDSVKSMIIGLSKLNRIVDFLSRRPQVQENLTANIHQVINEVIGDNKGVAVQIEATHTCVSHRGIGQDSTMKTAKLSGLFWSNEIGTRQEFLRYIADLKK